MRQYKRLTPKTLSRRLQLGRGQGAGVSYKPIHTVRDVVSYSLASRVPGIKTKRLHHVLGELDRDYLTILEWSDSVVDIRESFPLDLKSTLDIANRIGLEHPREGKTKQPIALVTSFVLTVQDPDGKAFTVARCVTNENKLTEKRLRVLEIERAYWEERNTDWGIVTAQMIDPVLVHNIRWVAVARDLRTMSQLSEEIIWRVEPDIFEFITTSGLGLTTSALQFDDRIGWRPGTTLWLIRHLIWKRVWEVDMYSKVDVGKPLLILIRNIR